MSVGRLKWRGISRDDVHRPQTSSGHRSGRACSVSVQDRVEPTVCRNIISGFENIIRVERTQSGAGRIADRSRNIFRVMQQRVPNESSELRIGQEHFSGTPCGGGQKWCWDRSMNSFPVGSTVVDERNYIRIGL